MKWAGAKTETITAGLQPSREPSSEDLRRRIVNCLILRQFPEVARLEIDVDRGRVLVQGRLPDAHAKWLCLELCRHVAGVVRLIDAVEVQSVR